MAPSIRTCPRQALAYASGEHDDASDKQPNQTETYLDAMTLPSFQPLAIGHPALTANRSQPAASPTHSEGQSNGQASTNEEAQRARSMNIYACILVVIGYTVVIWKEPSAMERYDIDETHDFRSGETNECVWCHYATTLGIDE